MAIEFDIRIIGDTPLDVIRGLGELSARMAGGLGVVAPQADTPDAPAAAAPEKPNGAEPTPAKVVKAKKAAAPPEVAGAFVRSLNRAEIIDGLTKIYSKGDEDVRLAITKFRDGQGADRLRDLKDDALPAAAELLTELKLAAESPAV